MFTKFKITITYINGEISIFEEESICKNFYNAIETDLTHIGKLIFSDDCKEYDFEIIK